jgi:hypothetical protein
MVHRRQSLAHLVTCHGLRLPLYWLRLCLRARWGSSAGAFTAGHAGADSRGVRSTIVCPGRPRDSNPQPAD